MNLYNKVCIQLSRRITWSYSTSFTLGIKMLHKKLHDPIYSIYGFVRLADEIVDTFHDYDKDVLFKRFSQQTWEAVNEQISTNPILQSFQLTVHKYNIDHKLITAFLQSMEMDLHRNNHSTNSYNEYIFGSAEVVGLMCLKVFCDGDAVDYERLKSPAQKLGAAFQKVNFLRDLNSDFVDRGRTYFPSVDLSNFNDQTKREIEQDIDHDFKDAYKGNIELPNEARFGVYVAYIYYQALLRKIKNKPAHSIKTERVRVPNKEKIALLFACWCRFRLNIL
jgi:phytoene synthase